MKSKYVKLSASILFLSSISFGSDSGSGRNTSSNLVEMYGSDDSGSDTSKGSSLKSRFGEGQNDPRLFPLDESQEVEVGSETNNRVAVVGPGLNRPKDKVINGLSKLKGSPLSLQSPEAWLDELPGSEERLSPVPSNNEVLNSDDNSSFWHESPVPLTKNERLRQQRIQDEKHSQEIMGILKKYAENPSGGQSSAVKRSSRPYIEGSIRSVSPVKSDDGIKEVATSQSKEKDCNAWIEQASRSSDEERAISLVQVQKDNKSDLLSGSQALLGDGIMSNNNPAMNQVLRSQTEISNNGNYHNMSPNRLRALVLEQEEYPFLVAKYIVDLARGMVDSGNEHNMDAAIRQAIEAEKQRCCCSRGCHWMYAWCCGPCCESEDI